MTAGLLAGCASSYQPMAGQPTASLVFTKRTPMPTDVVGLWTVRSSKCPLVEKVHLLGGQAISSSLKSVSIEAGAPFFLQAEHVSIWLGKTCRTAAMFTPVEGASYFVQSTLSNEGCELILHRKYGNSLRPDPTFKQLPGFADEALCTPFGRDGSSN